MNDTDGDSGSRRRADAPVPTSPRTTTPAKPTPNDGDTAPLPPTANSGRRAVWWLLPALTFVVGVALGAGVVGAVTYGADRNGPAGAAPPTTSTASAPASSPVVGAGGSSASASGEVTVTVPAVCASLAQDARRAADLLAQGADAARDLDASRLAGITRQMQDVRDRLSSQSAACTNAGVDTATTSASG